MQIALARISHDIQSQILDGRFGLENLLGLLQTLHPLFVLGHLGKLLPHFRHLLHFLRMREAEFVIRIQLEAFADLTAREETNTDPGFDSVQSPETPASGNSLSYQSIRRETGKERIPQRLVEIADRVE